MSKIYIAIAHGGKWACAEANGKHRYNKIRLIGDFRLFDTFDEADQVARDVAAGKYGRTKGEYISNR